MGFYADVIFPYLCDLFLDRPHVAEQRRALLAGAAGDVLEIGFGSGLNLAHYPAAVHQVTAVDPSPGMRRRARKRIEQSGRPVDQRLLGGERLPFGAAAFDCVVSTFTLCSIPDVRRALAEVYRVLRPGGRFLFLEHGLSREPRVQRWQRRLNGLEQWLAGGCRLDRDIKALVTELPFSSVEVKESYLPKTPRTHGYLYRGVTRK